MILRFMTLCNAELSALFLQSSVSRAPSEIILMCWSAQFLSNIENSRTVVKMVIHFFQDFFDEYDVQKTSIYLK